MTTIATPMPTTMHVRHRLHERHDKIRHLLRAARNRADEHLSFGWEIPSDLQDAIRRLEAERIAVEQRIDDAYL